MLRKWIYIYFSPSFGPFFFWIDFVSLQAGSVYQLHGTPSPSTWITTPMPTAFAQPQQLEGSARKAITVPQGAPSPFPVHLEPTAMGQVGTQLLYTVRWSYNDLYNRHSRELHKLSTTEYKISLDCLWRFRLSLFQILFRVQLNHHRFGIKSWNVGTTESIVNAWCLVSCSGLSRPSGSCSAGYYCSGGASQPNPTDKLTGNLCPPGSFCGNGLLPSSQELIVFFQQLLHKTCVMLWNRARRPWRPAVEGSRDLWRIYVVFLLLMLGWLKIVQVIVCHIHYSLSVGR